jgi:Domain of unknown function (DUF222)
LAAALADRLRITRADASRRIGEAAELGDRARRRGVTIGNQGIDGMSPITGYLTPEARATLDAVLAKLAAPGMCNPFDQQPVVDGTPSQDAIDGDSRSCAQRNHDGLNAECYI